MIVAPDFVDHWRTRMLVALLGNDELAPVYLLRLWSHCQSRKKWVFDDVPPAGLMGICRYSGDAQRFESAMQEAGFIKRANGSLEAVGWAEYNAQLIASWTNGKTGGRPRKQKDKDAEKTHGKPTGNPQATHGQTDKRREDKSRDDSLRSSSQRAQPVDNSGSRNDETTTEGEQHAHLTPETDENGSGADGEEPPPSEAWQGGASGGAGGSREPATYSRTSEMAISIAWLREQGVTIEADSELIAEWAARGVTQGLVEKALAKARTYKLNRIPEKYLATIVAEKLSEKSKPARMSVGQDEASVKAAARALGMGEGNPGESLPELRRRVLQRMSETEHAS